MVVVEEVEGLRKLEGVLGDEGWLLHGDRRGHAVVE